MFVLELNLYHSQVAVVLDALRLPSLIGMPEDAFSAPDAKARNTMLQMGISHLVDQRLASRKPNGSIALDEDVAAIIKVAADGEYAAVIIKDVTGVGKQLFVHAATQNAVVEHTRPEEDRHRFGVLKSRASLRPRWAEILPVPAVASGQAAAVQCKLRNFEKAVSLAKDQQARQAEQLLLSPQQQPAEKEAITRLVDAMAHPAYSANIALIRRESGLIMDARNFMLLVGRQTSWLISQTTPGAASLVIQAVSGSAASDFTQQQWDDLCRSKNKP